MGRVMIENKHILCEANGIEYTYFNSSAMIDLTDFYFTDFDFNIYFWRSEKMVFCGDYDYYGMVWVGDFDKDEEVITIHAAYSPDCVDVMKKCFSALKEDGFIKDFNVDDILYYYGEKK